jgi:aminoglycoside phosphotransferase (APT) family kinase protein
MSDVAVKAPEIDAAALGRWLEARTEARAPLTASLISGGRSNLTYGVEDRDGRRFVLRRPPGGKLQGSAHDMGRESTIIAALGPTDVPVPGVVGFEPGSEAAGAPFFVMNFVGGATVGDPPAVAGLDLDARQRVAAEMATVLARLHRLDPLEIGLADLVREGGLIERQLRRWRRQLDGYPELTSTRLIGVGDELAARVPTQQRRALVHGDYKLGNLRIDEDGGILAVLDWELTAIGDPLVDIGWLLASWAEPGDTGRWIVDPPTMTAGFPSRAELTAAIDAATDLDLAEIDYYVAFAFWRWSCINEGIIARFASGSMGGKQIDLDSARAQIRWQLASAEELLAGRASVRSDSRHSWI